MKAVVINLPVRKDRRREMQEQLAAAGMEAEFFRAIRTSHPGEFPSLGARGCFLSHLEVLRHGLRAKVDRLLIMEDDLNFSRTFRHEWPIALTAIEQQKEWGIFYPAPHASVPHSALGLEEILSTSPVLCAHMVLFNAAVIERVIAGLEAILSRPVGHPLGGPMPVDGAYNTLRAQDPEIKTFGYFPALGYQRSSRSDIAQDKLLDQFSVLRPAMRLVRKVINITGIKRPR